MKQNIDKSGRLARAITGALCVLAAPALWLLDWPQPGVWRWLMVVLLVAVGVFQLFEARKGWCVMRACGVKTPM